MDYGETFLVIEGSNLTNSISKLSNLTIEDNVYGYTRANNQTITYSLRNGNFLYIISPLCNIPDLMTYYKGHNTIQATKLETYISFNTLSTNTQINRIGFYTLGEILSLYTDLQAYGWRYNYADNLKIQSFDDTNESRVYVNNKAETAPDINLAKLIIRSIGNLPSTYTNQDLRNLNFDETGAKFKYDILDNRTNTTKILLNSDQYVFFPTMYTNLQITGGKYYAYKDGKKYTETKVVQDGASATYYSYTRNFKAGNNSCVLPFDVNVSDLTNAGLTAYIFNSYASGKANFETASGTISAGTPIIINASEAGLYMIPAASIPNLITTPNYYYEAISSSDKFVGSFVYEAPTTYTNRYALDTNANEFKIMNDGIYTTYYRAFLSLSTTAPAKSIGINTGGTTGISEINNPTRNDDAYYNLQGMKIDSNNLTHGIYIHNGKKIIK